MMRMRSSVTLLASSSPSSLVMAIWRGPRKVMETAPSFHRKDLFLMAVLAVAEDRVEVRQRAGPYHPVSSTRAFSFSEEVLHSEMTILIT